MTQRFTLDAQIDCVQRARALVDQNPTRQRASTVEFESAILTHVIETLSWLRRHEKTVRDRTGEQRP